MLLMTVLAPLGLRIHSLDPGHRGKSVPWVSLVAFAGLVRPLMLHLGWCQLTFPFGTRVSEAPDYIGVLAQSPPCLTQQYLLSTLWPVLSKQDEMTWHDT